MSSSVSYLLYYNAIKFDIMKIERKYRPTQIECRLHDKAYYDRCVEINENNKRYLEEHPSLDDNSVLIMKDVIKMNDNAIKKCELIFKSSHRTKRPKYNKRLRKQ